MKKNTRQAKKITSGKVSSVAANIGAIEWYLQCSDSAARRKSYGKKTKETKAISKCEKWLKRSGLPTNAKQLRQLVADYRTTDHKKKTPFRPKRYGAGTIYIDEAERRDDIYIEGFNQAIDEGRTEEQAHVFARAYVDECVCEF